MFEDFGHLFSGYRSARRGGHGLGRRSLFQNGCRLGLGAFLINRKRNTGQEKHRSQNSRQPGKHVSRTAGAQ